MFGHLKAEDFINLIEDGESPAKESKSQSHLQTCVQCSEAFVSAQSLHTEMLKSAVDEEEIPEPDWFQFRADVRNTMLSRAAQRQSRMNSWSGWLLKPAMSWALAGAFTVGLASGVLIWNHPGTVPVPAQVSSIETPSAATEPGSIADLERNDSASMLGEVAVEPAASEPSLATWSQSSIFEELSQLDDVQAEKLQQLLEASTRHSPGHP